MNVNELVNEPVSWLTHYEREPTAVLSSRVRLARNLRNTPFPHNESPEHREEVWRAAVDALKDEPVLGLSDERPLSSVSEHECTILEERRLVSPQLLEHDDGSGFVLNAARDVSFMINEEDHFRVHVLKPGMALQQAWASLETADEWLNRRFHIAFDRDRGFLTACPTNIGTGMRASVLLHLPVLHLTGYAEQMNRAMRDTDLVARGFQGENSEPVGGFFQISNQVTLGPSEEEILEKVERMVCRVCWFEKYVRAHVIHEKPYWLYDLIGRAYGQLRYSYYMRFEEALKLLSMVRLGSELGVLRRVRASDCDQLMIRLQEGHLRGEGEEACDEHDIGRRRASLLRGHF